ncbi:MAG: hypothetical protein IKW13_03460 [Thermoguttaceae bacterium]|nr:hypothetical protein [Thermoguttaceae bacterium]
MLAQKLCEVENPSHDNIILQLPTSQCSIKIGTYQDVLPSVYNYRKSEPLKGRVELLTPAGEVLGKTEEFEVMAGESAQPVMNIFMNGLDEGDYKIRMVENDEVIVERKAHISAREVFDVKLSNIHTTFDQIEKIGVEFTNKDDFDFEAELDWEEEEAIKVGGARVAQKPISAPTLVPETSVAKATARPSTRFSAALDLVEANANADESDNYGTSILAADDAPTLATDDETFLTDAPPLLLDFENELLEGTDENASNVRGDAESTQVAKPAPLAAFPAPNADDAVALPSLPALVADDASPESSESASLPILVFDDATEATPSTASNVSTANETATLEDVPLLLLPDVEMSDAQPTVETPKKTASRSTPKVALKSDLTPPLKTRGRAVAPIVPNAKKPSPSVKTTPDAQPETPSAKTTPDAQPTPTEAPVWRAVEPKPARPQAQVAPPSAKTARVATEKGATFRKPEIH